MKKRLIKKFSKRAVPYIRHFGYRDVAQECESEEYELVPKGTWCYYWNSGYEYQEWEFVPAYDTLKNILFRNYAVSRIEYCEIKKDVSLIYDFKPDLSSPRKVFALAKKLIKENEEKRQIMLEKIANDDII